MKRLVKLQRQWMVRSFAFAERCVKGYEDGEKDISRQYERPGIATSLDAQTLGKAAECAFCIDNDLDPMTALDWTPKLDPGWDVVIRERKIDVKGTDTEMLMWPVTKNAFLEQCPADLFVLVRRLVRPRTKTMKDILEADTFEVSGWVTVKEFIAKHHTAPPPSWLDAGTKHMHMDELRLFTDASRAGYRNGFVGYGRDGHLLHYCWCGRDAGHGFGVRLLKDQLGEWFCVEHKPKEQPDGTTQEEATG
jgi:hypothetical protein